MNNKVVIIGCGNVGMAYAYALVNQRTYVNSLVLIDINKERTEGEGGLYRVQEPRQWQYILDQGIGWFPLYVCRYN